MSLQEQFEKAASDVANLKEQPGNDDLLEIYALFKQSTVGDVNTSRPGLFDLKGKAKWDAWNSKKGLASDVAKQQYVDKVAALITTVGLK